MQRVAWVHLRLFVPPVPRGVCLFEIKQRYTVVQSHVSINAPSQRGDRVRPVASGFFCVLWFAHGLSIVRLVGVSPYSQREDFRSGN